MLYELKRILLVASVFAGLCAPAQANTTAAAPTPTDNTYADSASAHGTTTTAPMLLAQNDISINSETAGSTVTPPVIPPLPKSLVPARIALLLPLRSDSFNKAAEVVRAGFLAAFEQETDNPPVIDVIETGDVPQEVLSSYNNALLDHDIVVGPLSRSDVALVAQTATVSKPTLALTQADAQGDGEITLPGKMLFMGLSVEEESRQVATWASKRSIGKAFVVSTASAWQRRSAKAFATQWQRQNMEMETMELGAAGGYLTAAAAVQLKKRLLAEKPALLFAALDAEQARQMRLVIGNDVVIYGTSQLNPLTLSSWESAERVPEMNGVYLVDMPWQLQADHPAVMIYPRPDVNPDQKRSADMERLYALGIDAYRVAKEIALEKSHFEIDGVTGRLTVEFGKGTPRFQRLAVPAIYRNGSVVPLVDAR